MAYPPGFRGPRKDRLTRERRSANMRAIKAFGTKPELIVKAWLREVDKSWDEHVHGLQGRPDFVFRETKQIVFVYGDFWHGWRFPAWRNRLSKTYWQPKIDRNRRRDIRNRRALRRAGWNILILWEHQILREPEVAVDRLRRFLEGGTVSR